MVDFKKYPTPTYIYRMKIFSVFRVVYLIAIISLISSCGTLIKTYLGVKDPTYFEHNDVRTEYYEKLTKDVLYTNETRTFNDTTVLMKSFWKVNEYGFPLVIVKDTKTGNNYHISCYDDVEYDVDLLNNNNFENLTQAEPDLVKYVQEVISTDTEVISKQENSSSGKFDLYFISAVYMGKKLQRKSNYISEINGINKLTIIDLSVDAKHFKSQWKE